MRSVMSKPLTLLGCVILLVVGGCIDPAHEKPPSARIVSVKHFVLSDPATGEIWAETCGAVGSNEHTDIGSQVVLPAPLEREYQVDLSAVSIEGSIERDADRKEYCQRSDGHYGLLHIDPTCTSSSEPSVHELISVEVLDESGEPVSRDSTGWLRTSKRGDIERFRFLSHAHGAVYVNTSVYPCTDDAGVTTSAGRLFNIVPPDGASP